MQGFESRWQFPNACGAMDGKHVTTTCPPDSGSTYYNYKHRFSTVLYVVVDANYNFLYIEVGTNGRVNDAAVFANSDFNAALRTNSLHVPERGVFLGDDAFPLRTDLLKPFPRASRLTETQKVFNYRLSRARRVVENAFGILVAKFRVFETAIALNHETTNDLVRAACALHNWLRKTSAPAKAPDTREGLVAEEGARAARGSDVNHGGLVNLPPYATKEPQKAAAETRLHYAERFMTTDAVPWQWSRI